MSAFQDSNTMIQLARCGDGEAVAELLEEYRNYLRMIARLWIERSAHASLEASDLVQETLVRAQRKFGQFQGNSEPELAAWLRRILARKIVDLAKAAQRKIGQAAVEPMKDDSLGGVQHLLQGNLTSPTQAAHRRELGVVLANALTELASDRREVVELRSIQELDWEEVAARMGRSKDAVRMLWIRALKDLRPLLEESL